MKIFRRREHNGRRSALIGPREVLRQLKNVRVAASCERKVPFSMIFALTYFVNRQRKATSSGFFFLHQLQNYERQKKRVLCFFVASRELCFRALGEANTTEKKKTTNKSQRVTTFENENLGQMHLSLARSLARRAQQSVSVCSCNCCGAGECQ
jgi:hypothetical protein